MNEFEQQMLSFMKSVDERLSSIESDVSTLKSDVTFLKSDVSVLKNDVSEMKEDLEITRVAANYNGEKLEEIAVDLKKMHVIS